MPEIADFIKFDFEPGTSGSHSSLQITDNSYVTLRTFIDKFLLSLPPIVPTLAELMSLIFKNRGCTRIKGQLCRHSLALSFVQ
jgi:hypothetical protein